MATTTVPPAPPKKVNRIGLEVAAYRGSKTTLCAGCGHNAISERIIEAFYEMGVEPYRVAKLSGIGCSSKSPAYFLGTPVRLQCRSRAHALDRHGHPAGQPDLIALGVSGRRRHGFHRHRAVCSPDAPESADDLHHRGQRRLRPDQRTVLRHGRHRLETEDRRDQRPAAD